jgi:hypothetical protein
MDYDKLKQLERELVIVLKEEYSFYQSLYILLDRQHDLIKYNSDDRLLDLFMEIERCHGRIKESEGKITELKNRNAEAFRMAALLPEVKKIVNSIVTLVKKNMNLVSECEDYMKERYDRIQVELGELKNSHKILQYIRDVEPMPQFVDRKQ